MYECVRFSTIPFMAFCAEIFQYRLVHCSHIDFFAPVILFFGKPRYLQQYVKRLLINKFKMKPRESERESEREREKDISAAEYVHIQQGRCEKKLRFHVTSRFCNSHFQCEVLTSFLNKRKKIEWSSFFLTPPPPSSFP